MLNHTLLTLDTDWAPDHTIDFVAELLIAHKVKATWFVTHQSPAITRLGACKDLFELGIHPNFLPGSSHGKTQEEVIKHCLEIVPGAESMRTHSLLQTTPLLQKMTLQTTIKFDVSLFLPHTPFLQPVEYQFGKRSLLRIPFYWEDDLEMERVKPCWDLPALLETGPGLKIFNFHPIHIYLNSRTMDSYRAVKQQAPRLQQATETETVPFIQDGQGTRTLFFDVIKYLADSKSSIQVRDLGYKWFEARKEDAK